MMNFLNFCNEWLWLSIILLIVGLIGVFFFGNLNLFCNAFGGWQKKRNEFISESFLLLAALISIASALGVIAGIFAGIANSIRSW